MSICIDSNRTFIRIRLTKMVRDCMQINERLYLLTGYVSAADSLPIFNSDRYLELQTVYRLNRYFTKESIFLREKLSKVLQTDR